jgi:hypothetical protein
MTNLAHSANNHYYQTLNTAFFIWDRTGYRYIELNPVRVAMMASPTDYRWSSYKANALGEYDALIRPHPRYLELGTDEHERCQVYRALFRHPLDDEKFHELRSSLQTGTPLGTDRFREEIEKALKIKAGYARRERPRKQEGKRKGLQKKREKGSDPFSDPFL